MNKILVIENDNILRANLKELLELNNYIVIEADKGETALKKIRHSSPDLVISNLFLPGMSGVKIQKNFLQLEENCTTPFLFLSSINPNDFSHHLNSKVESLLIKPFENKVLLDRINSILKRKQNITQDIEEKNEYDSASDNSIRENLFKIISITDSISMKYDEYTKEELVGLLSTIKFSGIRIKDSINEYLMNSDIECFIKCSKKEAFDINTIRMEELLYEVSSNYGRNKDLIINIGECKSNIPLSFLENTLRELTKTAFRFTKRGTPIEVFTKSLKNKFIFGIKEGKECFMEKLKERNFLEMQPFSSICKMTKNLNGEFLVKGNKMYCSFIIEG